MAVRAVRRPGGDGMLAGVGKLGGNGVTRRQGAGGESPGWLPALGLVLLLHAGVWLGYARWLAEKPHARPLPQVEVSLLALAPAPEPRVAAHRPQHPGPAAQAQPRLAKAGPRVAAAPAALPSPAPEPTLVPVPAPAPASAGTAADVPGPPPTAPAGPPAPPAWEPPQFAPAYLHNPPPEYPAFARRHGMEGKVLVSARVGADGTCLQAKLKSGSGYRILDRAALEAVRDWRFVPGRRGGEPEAAWVDVPIVFNLKD